MKLRWWYYYAIHRRLVKWILSWCKFKQILVVVFISKLNFSFSFRFVDENCRIFVAIVVVVFVMKINLFSSTKIFAFVVVDEKNTATYKNRKQKKLSDKKSSRPASL